MALEIGVALREFHRIPRNSRIGFIRIFIMSKDSNSIVLRDFIGFSDFIGFFTFFWISTISKEFNEISIFSRFLQFFKGFCWIENSRDFKGFL